jgi:hypothetical protein
MYFYELSESDDEIFTNVILAHDSEYDEDEFLELVLEARAKVIERFEEESLIEAIANELERTGAFVHINDRHLRAAVNVSADEGETVITPVEETPLAAPAAVEDFRTLLVDIEPEEQRWRDN